MEELKKIELNEEAIELLSKCVIKQIEVWSKIGENVYPNRELTDLVRIECGRLLTLLNYLNS